MNRDRIVYEVRLVPAIGDSQTAEVPALFINGVVSYDAAGWSAESILRMWDNAAPEMPALVWMDGEQGTSVLSQIERTRWLQSRRLVMVFMIVSNDAVDFQKYQPCTRTVSGGLVIAGPNLAYFRGEQDAGFGIAVGIAASAVGAGALWGAGQAGVNGDYQGAALSIAKSYAGADTPAGQGGTSMFDDIDTSAFDSFNYSAGEASVAFSDSQNVDYGFGFMGTSGLPFDPNQTVGFGAMADPTGNITNYDYGTTPEVVTNQFGTHFDPSFSDDVIGVAGRNGIPIATQIVGQVARSTRPSQTGQRSGGGALGAKGDGTGSNDVIGTMAGLLSSVAGVVTSAQETTARPRYYHGQLTPSGGVSDGGTTHSNLMMVAAALIGVALVLHLGK